MKKTRLIKIWRVVLGIATEITMAVFITVCALGLSWLIARK